MLHFSSQRILGDKHVVTSWQLTWQPVSCFRNLFDCALPGVACAGLPYLVLSLSDIIVSHQGNLQQRDLLRLRRSRLYLNLRPNRLQGGDVEGWPGLPLLLISLEDSKEDRMKVSLSMKTHTRATKLLRMVAARRRNLVYLPPPSLAPTTTTPVQEQNQLLCPQKGVVAVVQLHHRRPKSNLDDDRQRKNSS